MIDKKLKTMIERNPVAFATSDENGNPHVIAVAYVKVVEKDKLLVTDNYMRKTTENLLKNNRVALAVWDKNWNGYRIKGTAQYFTSGKWKKFVEQMKENKGLPAKSAILITIDEIRKLVS